MRKPTAIDLFCGAGGLTQGLKAAGYRVVGAAELDELACTAYKANHPGVRLWKGDIRELTGPVVLRALRLKRGDLDLLAACPPCQGFSTMRTRNGVQRNRDPRNRLILEVLRLARSIRPKTVMLENVPGFSRSTHFRAFRIGLESLGYIVKWRILNTAHFAVPQSRRRLVLLASRQCEPLFAREARKRRTVKAAIGHLPAPSRSRDRLHNYSVRRSPDVLERIRWIPQNGGSREDLGAEAQLECHQKFQGFRDVYGRMAWNDVAPTITGGCINPSKGRFLHPAANRAITLREAALLQSFPARYRFPLEEGGRYAVALLIGNALPPEFIRRHAEALLKGERGRVSSDG
jgi:DNA (cytosine-5)-methyltransferase 1